jgi:hypothetical protein
MRDITPKEMRCSYGACPAVYELDADTILIVGAKLPPDLKNALSGKVDSGESAIIVSKQLLAEVNLPSDTPPQDTVADGKIAARLRACLDRVFAPAPDKAYNAAVDIDTLERKREQAWNIAFGRRAKRAKEQDRDSHTLENPS